MLEHLTVTEDREIFFNVEERPCYYSHPVQEHLNIVLGGEGYAAILVLLYLTRKYSLVMVITFRPPTRTIV